MKTKSNLHRLRDIEPAEVSIVDRGANKRRFLTVKRGSDDDDRSSSIDKMVEQLKVAKELRDAMSDAVESLYGAFYKLDEGDPADVDVDGAIDEFEAVGKALLQIVSEMKADDDEGQGDSDDDHGDDADEDDETAHEPDESEKAEWTTQYVNDLPDAAFAVILPGGRKDEGGKTVPRSLRLLPHHNDSVTNPTDNATVDLPHLRNALARANQIDAPDDVKRRAMSHLEAHASELLKTKKSDSKWMATMKDTFEELRRIIENNKKAPQDAPGGFGPNLGSGVQPDGTAVGSYRDAFGDDMKNMMKAIKNVAASVEKLSNQVSENRETLEKQAGAISGISKTVDLPSSSKPNGAVVVSKRSDVTWPLDMNRPDSV